MIAAGNRTQQFKGWTLTYDADGNVISKAKAGETWTYTWDPFNKLTHVAKNGVVELRFMYDAFGRRVIRCFDATCSTAERLVNDGDQLVLARSGSSGITDIYGYYPGGDHPLAVQYGSGKKLVYLTDPQLNATVRGLADTNRTAANPLVKDYEIGPWGEVAADTGLQTRLRLAGQQYDQQAGLYYMRARYYDPELGRFLSEDPIGIAGGLNLYAYAGNDPVNLWDPSGLGPLDPCTDANGVAGRYHRDGKTCITWVPILDDIHVDSGTPVDIVTIERGNRGGAAAAWSVGSAPREEVAAGNASACAKEIVFTVIDVGLSLTGVKLVKSLNRARRGLEAALGQTNVLVTATRLQRTSAFGVTTTALVMNNRIGELTAVNRTLAGAGTARSLAGVTSLEGLAIGVVETAGGFAPPVIGAALGVVVGGYRVIQTCF